METDRLAELIDCKQEVLTQLWQLAERQTRLVQQDDITSLLGLLAAKQKLLGRLQDIERQLDAFRQQDPDSRIWRSPEARERTRQSAQRCQTLLDEIMQVEQQCESELVQRRDATAQRLQGAHSAFQARQAYTGSHDARRGQIDLSSET